MPGLLMLPGYIVIDENKMVILEHFWSRDCDVTSGLIDQGETGSDVTVTWLESIKNPHIIKAIDEMILGD